MAYAASEQRSPGCLSPEQQRPAHTRHRPSPAKAGKRLRRITLIFKSYPGCSVQKIYQATTNDLPLAFTDGTTNGGLQEGPGNLQIPEKLDMRQVVIQAHYIGSTVIIRQVDHYLTFAIRILEDILGISELSTNLQPCLHGCPPNELIQEHWLSPASSSLLWLSSQQAYTVESATEQCNHLLPVEDMYFQSCVFDLLTTGNFEFSIASYGALKDMKALNLNKLQLHPASKAAHSASRRPGLRQMDAILLPGLLVFFLLPIQFLTAVISLSQQQHKAGHIEEDSATPRSTNKPHLLKWKGKKIYP